LAVLVVALAGCLAFAAPALGQEVGRLSMAAGGLPQGVKAKLVLHGPGRDRVVRFSGARSIRLAAGSYAADVRPVTIEKPAHGIRRGAIAYPARARVRFAVKGGATSQVSIGYRAVVNAGVVPLPDAAIRQVVGPPANPSALVFRAGAGAPAIGTVYVGAPSARLPRGLISKVTSAKRTAAGLRVSLVAVPVTDAVPALDFDGQIPLQPVDGSAAAPVARGGRSAASASKSACAPPKLVKFHAHLDSFELRHATLDAWPPQMRLTLAIRTTESLGVAAVAAGINCDWTLAELGPFQAAIPVGPIVIPVYATVPVKAGIHVNGRLDVGTVNVASTTVASAATGVSENRASLSQEGSNVWTSGVLSLSGSAKLYASAGVEAGIGVAKGANAHIAAGFGPEFNWSSGQPCSLFLNLGALSAGVTILGKNLNTPAFTPVRPRLWSGCGGSGGPDGPGRGGSAGGPGSAGGGNGDGNRPRLPLPPIATSRLDAGGTHSCFVSGGGRVFCWGSNQYGELGTGTRVDSISPIEVPGVTGAVGVTSGGNFSAALADTGESCALLASGEVFCWGYSPPRRVADLPPASDVSSSSQKTCAVVEGGEVYCWVSPALPLERIEGIQGATAVATGGDYACALLASGEVRCWGSNSAGQLGDGSTSASSTPVAVHGITTAKAIDASNGSATQACAVLADGSVECWGGDGFGIHELPEPIEDVIGAVDVSVGDAHACALLGAREVACWGYDGYGQLGFDTPRGTLPLYGWGHRVNGITQAQAVSAGGQHTCALVSDGVKCWGDNAAGQLGQAAGRYAFAPVSVSGVHDATAIATGADAYESRGHSCVLRSGGAVWCWGANGSGQLGDGSFDDSPVPIAAGITGATAIAAGEADSCAALDDGTVACWGDFESGEHPYGSETPELIAGVEHAVAVGTSSAYLGKHSCALLEDGSVTCWGENERGELGAGDTGEHSTPVAVGGLGTVTQIAVGARHTCALVVGGGVKCWGSNEMGQLGDGTRESRATPVSVAGLTNAVQISAEGEDTCAALANGEVECWGSGFEGQFGTSVEASSVPVRIAGIEDARAATATPNQMCAALRSGSVTCWRDGAWWEVGPFYTSGGTTAGNRLDLSSLAGVTGLSAGNGHACAIRSGDVLCWGANENGELGNGTWSHSSTPRAVQNLPAA
jgi:alpha-tubulin suppressor-like RCC1 family protein